MEVLAARCTLVSERDEPFDPYLIAAGVLWCDVVWLVSTGELGAEFPVRLEAGHVIDTASQVGRQLASWLLARH